MGRSTFISALVVSVSCSFAHAQTTINNQFDALPEKTIATGKQLAVEPPYQAAWTIKDIKHRILGDITAASRKNALRKQIFQTKEEIATLVFVSCQKETKKIAIEMVNIAVSKPRATGLFPLVGQPRAECSRPTRIGPMTDEPMATTWEVTPDDTLLATGLEPATVRSCSALNITEEVRLPQQWTGRSGIDKTKITIPFAPYAKDLEPVFIACGANAAYAEGESPPNSAGVLVLRPQHYSNEVANKGKKGVKPPGGQ